MQNDTNIKKAHFAGICGVGMSAVATLLQEKGFAISGSDEGCHPPISDYLKEMKIPVAIKYKEKNLPNDVSVVVAGGNAKLKPGGNVELDKARVSDVPVKTFPDILNELTTNTHNILAVGSYGKSTCTTIMAWCLEHAGKNPSYFIGALPIQMKKPAHLGTSNVFILEGDEYPTSGIDSTSKFLYYNPKDILFISGKHDHVNIFPTQEDFLKPFIELLEKIPDDGLICACVDDPYVEQLVKKHLHKTKTYGLDTRKNPEWSALNINRGKTTTFDLTHNGEVVVQMKTVLLGDHNIQNIVGAIALLLERELLTPNEAASAIKDFKGITRRLDLKTEKSSVLVYEGFGSSREKAQAALDAVSAHFPNRRIVTVFEPHTFSWRNKLKIHWYDTVFDKSDVVFIYKPPVGKSGKHEGESKDGELSQKDILNRVLSAGVNAQAIDTPQDGLEKLEKMLSQDDLVLILTSGNLGGMVGEIPKLVEKLFPKK